MPPVAWCPGTQRARTIPGSFFMRNDVLGSMRHGRTLACISEASGKGGPSLPPRAMGTPVLSNAGRLALPEHSRQQALYIQQQQQPFGVPGQGAQAREVAAGGQQGG